MENIAENNISSAKYTIILWKTRIPAWSRWFSVDTSWCSWLLDDRDRALRTFVYTVGVSQNGRSFLPPPRPPDQFLKLFFSLPYFWLSWKYVQEVMLLWVYCVPHNVHLYKIGKFQFRKFYEFFLVPFFNNEKEAKTLIKRDKGMAVWYQGVGLQWFLPKNCKK